MNSIIISEIKIILYSIYKLIAIEIYNKKHGTSIMSVRASLHAQYGQNCNIGRKTLVADNVVIGDHSYVNENSYVENCSIGNYCSISDHVLIGPAEHKIECIVSHPVAGIKEPRRVQIGNDVLISHGVTVLQGVSIGDGAVIAAGAVVVNDVEPYSVYGGVPARKIKNRFDDENMIKCIKDDEVYKMDKTILQSYIEKKAFSEKCLRQ